MGYVCVYKVISDMKMHFTIYKKKNYICFNIIFRPQITNLNTL